MYITMKNNFATYELHTITIQEEDYLTRSLSSPPLDTYIILINDKYVLYTGTLDKCKELYILINYAICKKVNVHSISITEVNHKFELNTRLIPTYEKQIQSIKGNL